jgi:hypothetical protein
MIHLATWFTASIHDIRGNDRPGMIGQSAVCRRSAERECIRLHARIEELDLECAVSAIPRLPDQLIQPLLACHALAPLINVTAMRWSY